MPLRPKHSAHAREWEALCKQESRLLRRRLAEGPGFLERKLEGKIPEKLEETLTFAFSKAFSLVFSKGVRLIEKTYSKEAIRHDFVQKEQEAAADRDSRAALRRVFRRGDQSAARHVLLAGAEGGILGLLGIGLPDIPLFSALLLRNLYEIALSCGFSYESPTERFFLLRLIEVSLLRGEDYAREEAQLNAWIDGGATTHADETAQIRQSASALSAHLLYLKFIQGIPLIGLVGGLSDSLCLHRCAHYARLKYKRRFLQQGTAPHKPTKLD